ncbi:farnesyl cysteine-carboxyl methyltransferase [Oleoguttula sp. CCFEE 5521]
MARPSSSSSASRPSEATTIRATSREALINATAAARTARLASEDDDSVSYAFDKGDITPVTHTNASLTPFDPKLLPSGQLSLALISLQGFWTGFALAASLIIAPQLAYSGNGLWRFFAFLGSLSLFHFLEFWTTARFNTPAAQASSYLIYSNGTAYNVAHTCAALEILLSYSFFPGWQAWLSGPIMATIGLLVVITGQAVRSTAMATAGTNFNHIPQQARKEGHQLVTEGIYGVSRHPSYFGFFWWALGTQLLVGNKLCLVAYALVLRKFFSDRIRGEEKKLVEFYGQEYESYRARVPTGIPFI